jgi:hypothetical protein
VRYLSTMSVKPLTQNTFAKQFEKHAVIDTNHVSPALAAKLKETGLSLAELEKVAGPDGQIKGAEFKKLFSLVDGFDENSKDKKITLVKPDSKELTTSGMLNQALLDEVASNRSQARYSQPGTKAAEAQVPLTVADAQVVPHDVRLKEVDLKVKGQSQYDYAEAAGLDGDKACFATAVSQAEKFNTKTFGAKAPKLNGPDQVIQMAYREDDQGRVQVDDTQAKLGLSYINKALDAGYPAVVGASYADKNYNHDKLTDHFVTINKRGYDEAGRLFYEYKDPGDGGRTGKLYVHEETGKLFKEGDKKDAYVGSADYEITQVRTYQGL